MSYIQATYPIKNTPQSNDKPLRLQNGSVVIATVNKHLRDGLAEVSIAGRKINAKLDTPLDAGRNYLVKIGSSEDSVELKLMLADKSRQALLPNNMVQQLMEQLSLSKSKEMQSLITGMLKIGIPVGKDTMLLAQEWLTQTTDKELGIQTLLEMFKKDLPMTETIYRSLLAGKTPESITSIFNDLTAKLTGLENNSIVSRVLRSIESITNPLNGLIAEKLAGKALMLLLNDELAFSTKISAMKNLQSLGILPKSSTLANSKNELANGIVTTLRQSNDEKVSQFIKLLNETKISAKITSPLLTSAIEEVLVQMNNGHSPKEASVTKLLDFLFNTKQQSVERNFINQLFSLGVIKGMESLTHKYEGQLNKIGQGVPITSENQLFQKLYNEVKLEVANTIGGKEISQVLKDVIKSLGFNFEAQLSKLSGDLKQLESLKLHLIQLTREFPTGDIKDITEKLLFKLNAQPILSQQETSIHTIIQQFPLFLLGNKSDVSLQWRGKAKKDGTIDSDYCRILFYLELETLKETLIDMQVQNRIISINVWNEQEELKNAAAKLQPVLKKNLEKVGYQLSTVTFKKPIEKQRMTKNLVTSGQQVTYSGVDLRI